MDAREPSTGVPSRAGWVAGVVAVATAAVLLALASWWAVLAGGDDRLPVSSTAATSAPAPRCASARLAPGCQAPPCEKPGSACVLAVAGPSAMAVPHRVDRRVAGPVRATRWRWTWYVLP